MCPLPYCMCKIITNLLTSQRTDYVHASNAFQCISYAGTFHLVFDWSTFSGGLVYYQQWEQSCLLPLL